MSNGENKKKGRPLGVKNKTDTYRAAKEAAMRVLADKAILNDANIVPRFIRAIEVMSRIVDGDFDAQVCDRIGAARIIAAYNPPPKMRLMVIEYLMNLSAATPAEISECLRRIRTLAVSGTVTLEEAKVLNELVMDNLKVYEKGELADRLTVIEERLKIVKK